jgi:hypothetical protein
MTDATTPNEIRQDRQTRARAWFEFLQRRICDQLEQLDAEAPEALYPGAPGKFDFRPWTRETGTGGGVGGHFAGRLFEKAGVHTSGAAARFSPEMAATMPGAAEDPSYVSASISLIVHPRSPRVPTVHMNTRFLSTSESWFGGGADLTPMLDVQRTQEAGDTVAFHAASIPRSIRATRPGATSISSCRTGARPAASAASSTTSSIRAISSVTSPSPAPSAKLSWRSTRRSSAAAWPSPGPRPTGPSSWCAAAVTSSSTCSTTAGQCSA